MPQKKSTFFELRKHAAEGDEAWSTGSAAVGNSMFAFRQRSIWKSQSTNLGTSSCGGLFPKGPLASTARTNEANSRQCRGIFWLQWMSFDIFLSNAGKLLLIQTLKISQAGAMP
jgi:hypothetical protein